MADHLWNLESVREAIWPHEWHSYEEYLSVHYRYMTALTNEGLIVRDVLSFREIRAGNELILVRLTGFIECVGNVVIQVSKFLDVRRNSSNRYEVKGFRYLYHAYLRRSRLTLIRYDDCHGGALHRHCLDPETGDEIREAIGLDQLPTLADFVRQALSIAESVTQ